MTDTLKNLEAAWRSSPPDLSTLPDTMPLDALEVLPEIFQPRKIEEEDAKQPNRRARASGVVFAEHVVKLAAHLSNPGKELDPILVLRVGDRSIVVDGHHRTAAYTLKGRQGIPVRWFHDSPRAAYIEAGRQNFKETAQSSIATKSQLAWVMVCDDEMEWSRPQIIAATTVSEGTVANMRRARTQYKERRDAPPSLWQDARKGLQDDGDKGGGEQPQRVAQNVTEWTQRLRTHFPKLDNLGKAHMFAESVAKFSPKRAADIALWLVDELGLHEVVAAQHEQTLIELEHAYTLDD
ncbi:hypothetical protein [Paraburkholderia azotifigens]|uniref:ParB/Sulfiredoxin domain-containing protein n=1 Tax=Paraburkholderia azotifigens TaxID=2057004 RepID=A0ABU9R5Z0_9BURK